jgi:protease-4
MTDQPVKPSDHMTDTLVRDLIKDRRRDRLWRNIRFFAGFIFIATFLWLSLSQESGNRSLSSDEGEGKSYVSLVRLEGMIAPGKAFSAETVLPILKDAFADKNAKGVIIDINSGGGTPVQASIIHDEILKLKKKYHKKVIVVGEDLMASGAYFVAVSSDKIYANPNTITGSIGVIMQGFGFSDIIKKWGIERRVIASGENKDRLDPFKPENPADVAKIRSVVDQVHDNFNQAVLEGRKGKLHGDPKELFSGDFWTGEAALKLGLVDALGNLSDVMQTEFNVTRYRIYSDTNPVLKKIMDQLGASLELPLSYVEKGLSAKL